MERNKFQEESPCLQSNIIDGYPIALKDHVYYAKIIPNVGEYELYDLIIRRIAPTWFVGYDTTKGSLFSFLFENSAMGKYVFLDRKVALKKVKDAEEHGIKFTETEYEEYGND